MAVASVLLLFAHGCAVGPNYKRPPVSVNPAWGEQANERLNTRRPVDAAWWRTFNDPTLDRLIGLAQQNLPLQIAGLRILEARAQLGIAVGFQYPTNPGAIVSGGGGGLNGSDPLNLYFG